MPKRKETLYIEQQLHNMCAKKGLYGCEEITIGFYNNGHGNEIVDFCTMDSKGVLRCYEIKVSLSDLKSKAKKSWYGHYNYLLVTPELWYKISDNLNDYIPDYIGVAMPTKYSDEVAIVRKAKKQNISKEQELMMKESMIRSMSYKVQKYRDAADMQKFSELKRTLSKAEKENQQQKKEISRLGYIIMKAERILKRYYDCEINLAEVVKKIEEREILLPDTLLLSEKGKQYNASVLEEDNFHKEE